MNESIFYSILKTVVDENVREFWYPILIAGINSYIFTYLLSRKNKKEIREDIKKIQEVIISLISNSEKVIVATLSGKVDALQRNIKKITKKKKYTEICFAINKCLVSIEFEYYLRKSIPESVSSLNSKLKSFEKFKGFE